MIRVIIVLCAISRASLEMQMYQHQMHISRKSRSNSNPTQSGFVYSKVSNGPGTFTTPDNLYGKTTEKGASTESKEDISIKIVSNKPNQTDSQVYKNFATKHTLNKIKESAKAATKWPLLKGKEPNEKHLKSVLHFKTAPNNIEGMFSTYDSGQEFRVDDEDLRTDSQHIYNIWPYSYYGPYEYKIGYGDSRIDKAKDKRYVDAGTSINPVYENLDDHKPHSLEQSVTRPGYYIGATTDNPIYGNQPFFSFVLNDYFAGNNEEYPVVFKDFSWAEEFDHGSPYQEMDDNSRRSRRLDYNYYPSKGVIKDSDINYTAGFFDEKEVTERADTNQRYDKYDDGKKYHQSLEDEYKGRGHTGFKDFVDSFANKFGSENFNKNSVFKLKQDKDKGEKRKGFRRVYHKDEYQEDKEFYDNTNKKAQSEENGGLNSNIGGSQAILHSHAVASTGNGANSFKITEGGDDKLNNKMVSGNRKEYDSGIDHYRTIAKKAALSNNADYIE